MRIRDFLGGFSTAAAGAVADEPVDGARERKDGTPSGDADTGYRDEDEKWFVLQLGLGKEGEAEVDEDEVLGQLRHDLEDELGGQLSPSRHVVIRIMFHANAAEEERYDA